VVIHDLYLVGISFSPLEANPPLIVDADAILTLAIPRELFEVVARRDTQVFQLFCGVYYGELAPGYPVQVCRKTPGVLA
jgi:hypothetical protein